MHSLKPPISHHQKKCPSWPGPYFFLAYKVNTALSDRSIIEQSVVYPASYGLISNLWKWAISCGPDPLPDQSHPSPPLLSPTGSIRLGLLWSCQTSLTPPPSSPPQAVFVWACCGPVRPVSPPPPPLPHRQYSSGPAVVLSDQSHPSPLLSPTGSIRLGLLWSCQTSRGRPETCYVPSLCPEWLLVLVCLLCSCLCVSTTLVLLLLGAWSRRLYNAARWLGFAAGERRGGEGLGGGGRGRGGG